MKKRITALVLALVMCVGLAVPAVASENADSGVRVFQHTFDENSEEVNNIRNIVTYTNECQNKNCKIGSALVVYNLDTDAVFYLVPVLSGQECIGIVQMSTDLDVGISWTSDTTLYDKVFDLPEGDYILYVTGGVFYAESSNEIVLLQDMGFSMPSKDDYLNVSYEEKKEAFLSQAEEISTLSNCILQNKNGDADTENGYTLLPYGVEPIQECEYCDIKNFVSQNGPFCWAACIATIVNYKKDINLSAKDVARKIGIYGGASLDETRIALNSYGFSYYSTWDKMSWASVKNNIKNKYPFIIGLEMYDEDANLCRHMVTGYAYMCDNGDPNEASDRRYIQFWDPLSSTKQSFQYNKAANVLMDGYIWNWSASIFW